MSFGISLNTSNHREPTIQHSKLTKTFFSPSIVRPSVYISARKLGITKRIRVVTLLTEKLLRWIIRGRKKFFVTFCLHWPGRCLSKCLVRLPVVSHRVKLYLITCMIFHRIAVSLFFFVSVNCAILLRCLFCATVVSSDLDLCVVIEKRKTSVVRFNQHTMTDRRNLF